MTSSTESNSSDGKYGVWTDFRGDHFILMVNDLLSATRAFEQAGFIVTQGHFNGPTVNALITFNNGTYIEIAAMRGRGVRLFTKALKAIGIEYLLKTMIPAVGARFLPWFSAGQGWIDWCLFHPNLEAVIDASKSRGVKAMPAMHAARLAAGKKVEWLMGGPKFRTLPFLLQDITERTWRVPLGPRAQHPNGAVGVVAAKIAVKDAASAAEAFSKYLGVDLPAGHEFVLPGDGCRISFCDDTSRDPVVTDHLRKKGEGLCQITFGVSEAGGSPAEDTVICEAPIVFESGH